MKFKLKKLSILLAVVGGLTLSAASMLSGGNSSVFAADVVTDVKSVEQALDFAKPIVDRFYDDFYRKNARIYGEGKNVNGVSLTISYLEDLNKYVTELCVNLKKFFETADSVLNLKEKLRSFETYVYGVFKDMGFEKYDIRNVELVSRELFNKGFSNSSYNVEDKDCDVRVANLIKEIGIKTAVLMQEPERLMGLIDGRSNIGSVVNANVVEMTPTGDDVAVVKTSAPAGNVVVETKVENPVATTVTVQQDAADSPFGDMDVEGLIDSENSDSVDLDGLYNDIADTGAFGEAVNDVIQGEGTQEFELKRNDDSSEVLDDVNEAAFDREFTDAQRVMEVKNNYFKDLVDMNKVLNKFTVVHLEGPKYATSLASSSLFLHSLSNLMDRSDKGNLYVSNAMKSVKNLRKVLRGFLVNICERLEKVEGPYRKKYLEPLNEIKGELASLEEAISSAEAAGNKELLDKLDGDRKALSEKKTDLLSNISLINLAAKYRVLKKTRDFFSDVIANSLFDAQTKKDLSIGFDEKDERAREKVTDGDFYSIGEELLRAESETGLNSADTEELVNKYIAASKFLKSQIKGFVGKMNVFARKKNERVAVSKKRAKKLKRNKHKLYQQQIKKKNKDLLKGKSSSDEGNVKARSGSKKSGSKKVVKV